MKKVFIILLLFISVKIFTQVDTVKHWYSYTQSATINPTDLFLMYNGSVTRNIQYQYLNRLTYSTPWLYPNSSTINYAIGVSSNPLNTGHKLYVNGNQYLNGRLTFGTSEGLLFSNSGSRIYETAPLGEMMFYSPKYGSSVGLSDIMAQAGGSNLYLNGLTKSTVGTTNYHKLGGTLSEYTSIDAGAYPFQISNSAGGLISLSGTTLTLRDNYILVNPVNYYRVYTSSNSWRFSDTSLIANVEDHLFRLGYNSLELKGAIDKPVYINSAGGIGRVYIENIGHIKFIAQSEPSYEFGKIYLSSIDSILRIGKDGSYQIIGTGATGGGDVSLSGSLSLNHIVTGYDGTTVKSSNGEISTDTLKMPVIKITDFANETDTFGVGILPGTGGLLELIALKDTSASFGLTMPITTANDILKKQINGEIAWYYFDKKKNQIVTRYELAAYTSQQSQQMMVQNEINLRLIAKLEDRIDQLEKRRLFKRK